MFNFLFGRKKKTKTNTQENQTPTEPLSPTSPTDEPEDISHSSTSPIDETPPQASDIQTIKATITENNFEIEIFNENHNKNKIIQTQPDENFQLVSDSPNDSNAIEIILDDDEKEELITFNAQTFTDIDEKIHTAPPHVPDSDGDSTPQDNSDLEIEVFSADDPIHQQPPITAQTTNNTNEPATSDHNIETQEITQPSETSEDIQKIGNSEILKPADNAKIEDDEVKTDSDSPHQIPEQSEILEQHSESTSPTQTANLSSTEPTPVAEKTNWASRLRQGLSKSRQHMAKSLVSVFGGGKIDEDLYEELETVLLTSDMGIEATELLMEQVRQRVSLKGLKDGSELRQALKDALYDLIKPLEQPLILPDNGEPFVIMLAGINGAGKTTSIGKLAKYFQAQGKSVILAAGDTFRAAAREQLQEWGQRNGVTVVSQASGDSAAVCFDAVESAKARKIDVVLADTAGRLPTQLHLMEEIKKVKRVLQKSLPNAPHEIIVVLDANIGQNAINQVIAFDDALGVTGLIVTKLDGTAKGGILAGLVANRPIPVRYIGVGESIDDLRPFDAKAFVEALFD